MRAQAAPQNLDTSIDIYECERSKIFLLNFLNQVSYTQIAAFRPYLNLPMPVFVINVWRCLYKTL